MSTNRPTSVVAAILAVMLIGACGRQDAGPAAEAEPAATEEAVAGSGAPALPERTPSPAGAAVFFITPADGDTVPNPILVEFGIEGMSVVAAGIKVEQSGHHHLLIDTDLPDMALPVPADMHHIHFGDASTSTELTLAPGEHTLQLLLADHAHIPHDPPLMSDRITITVE